jgi:HEAT repeat protein
MMKFQFVRLQAPSAPTWNNQSRNWQPINGDGPPTTHETLWQHQWNWESGRRDEALTPIDGPESIPVLVDALNSRYEPDGMDAAYRLAALNGSAVSSLLDVLGSDNTHGARRAGYGLTAVGAAATDGLIEAVGSPSETARGYAAFALGEGQNPEAAAAVTNLMTDESAWVRFTAAEALGIMNNAAVSVPALIDSLQDADGQVRFTGALSLARVGSEAEEAVPALVTTLKDENRYVRANAVEALRQIGTPEATTAAFDHLMDSRWCYTTTPENSF